MPFNRAGMLDSFDEEFIKLHRSFLRQATIHSFPVDAVTVVAPPHRGSSDGTGRASDADSPGACIPANGSGAPSGCVVASELDNF